MPTKRYIKRYVHTPPTDPTEWAILSDTPMPPGHNPFTKFTFREKAHELWIEYGEQIVEEWATGDRHGMRPGYWWKFSAPRLDPEKIPNRMHDYDRCVLDLLIEPRIIISGSGKPGWEWWHENRYGIPKCWHGPRSSPPVFERQWDYLKRHGLLFPGERPALDEPEPDFEFVGNL